MATHASELPTGMAGLRYPITQVSLAVRDLDRTMEMFHRAFGWSGWDVFEHVPPMHHDTELRGERVHYTLRGAEVMVGDLNFELLEPTEGPNLWDEFIVARGEGIASIAVMFSTVAESEAVKREFSRLGIPVTMRARIGDHIEYYYLDTQERFGTLIESGCGHATDFVRPAYVYPQPGAETARPPGAPDYRITQISVVVRDLEAKMKAYHEAFGWGPWKIYQADGRTVMHDCRIDGRPSDFFNVRWAETDVGGGLNFELLSPVSGDNPWQRFLSEKGEGIASVAVMFTTERESEAVKETFRDLGIGVAASGRIGDHIEWYYLDTEPAFKCLIESGSGHALDFMEPVAVYP